MRKLSRWTSKEASNVYWLILWGCSNKDAVDLLKDVLPNRSVDAIGYMCTEMRKFISESYGYKMTIPSLEYTKKLARAGSKIEPIKEIKDLKPDDLTKVKFTPGVHKEKPLSVAHKINFEQLPEGIANVKNNSDIPKDITEQLKLPFKQQIEEGKKIANIVLRKKELSLEEVLKIAKNADAKKVEWNGYVIKFK